MTDSRRKQIEEAAKRIKEKYKFDPFPMNESLVEIAEWADANPNIETLRKMFLESVEKFEKCQSDRKILVEALKLYCGIAGHDCDNSTTKWSAADAVLKKIGEGK